MADKEKMAISGDAENTMLEQMGYQQGKFILLGLNHRKLVRCCNCKTHRSSNPGNSPLCHHNLVDGFEFGLINPLRFLTKLKS